MKIVINILIQCFVFLCFSAPTFTYRSSPICFYPSPPMPQFSAVPNSFVPNQQFIPTNSAMMGGQNQGGKLNVISHSYGSAFNHVFLFYLLNGNFYLKTKLWYLLISSTKWILDPEVQIKKQITTK